MSGARGRVTSGSFKPGQSGNPGGRPKTSDIGAVARLFWADAMRGLVACARLDPREHGNVVIAASREILAYGFGKPAQTVNLNAGAGDAPAQHLLAVRAMDDERAITALLEEPADTSDAAMEAVVVGEVDDTLPAEVVLPLWQTAPRVPQAAAPAPPELSPEEAEALLARSKAALDAVARSKRPRDDAPAAPAPGTVQPPAPSPPAAQAAPQPRPLTAQERVLAQMRAQALVPPPDGAAS